MRRFARTLSHIGPLLLLALLAALAAGCAAEASSQPAQRAGAGAEAERPAPAVNVAADVVRTGRLVERVTLLGTADPRRAVTLAAETAGRVEDVTVDVGDRVAVDQVLATVDVDLQRAQLRRARADARLARKTADRMKALAARDAVSRQELDEAEARLSQARAAVRIARVQAARSDVRASVAGVVTHRFVEPGEWVAPGQPVVSIAALDRVLVTAPVPERLVAKVRPRQPVSVAFDALDTAREGAVEAVVATADPESRTYTLRVTLDNADGRILGGMAARVTVAAGVHEDAVIVPRDAVLDLPGGAAAFVVEDDRAVRRTVRAGAASGERVVVLDGLAPGERLVTTGHRGLVDGQRVRLVAAPGDGAAAAASEPDRGEAGTDGPARVAAAPGDGR